MKLGRTFFSEIWEHVNGIAKKKKSETLDAKCGQNKFRNSNSKYENSRKTGRKLLKEAKVDKTTTK